MTPKSSFMKSTINFKTRQNSTPKPRSSVVSQDIMKKIKQNSEKVDEKIELIFQLLSKNSKIEKVSPIFYKIPDSAILKCKKWSLSNDKLAEVS